jgi:hypothetical protein
MRVSELSGLALDYWACRALLAEFQGQKLTPEVIEKVKNLIGSYPFHPSTDWATAGPIIARERIATYWDVDEWVALWHAEAGPAGTLHSNGPTMVGSSALVAAMRCFVAAKFGDEVSHEDA